MADINKPLVPEVIRAHGLTMVEYQKIIQITGREPNIVELGIFSAMWNEHCSYKSSKKWLRLLPTSGARVIQGPGENAGVVDIDDDLAVVFKIESHNHPSFIEPYQGAATGVGGILRDIFTMGARPIACLNSLKFGSVDDKNTRHLVSGVVAGIGGYGNSFGVPTIGGDVAFDDSYNGNILVNAFAAGLAKKDAIFYAKADKVGLPLVYLGAKTGRDGVGGASMASTGFDDDSEDKRPNVQVGDPFTEKCLMEACLELMAGGAVVAIQDMGAAGLTCSSVEMGSKGNLGIELNLDNVPVREAAMTAYEIMLSESQERMLLLLNPDKHDYARDVFARWQLDFAVIGETIAEPRFKIRHEGELVADLPINELGDEAPEYDRPVKISSPPVNPQFNLPDDENVNDSILRLLACPDLCSKAWIFNQYDYLIQGNTLQMPGSDAGVVRIGDSNRALAFSVDVTPRYCRADPFAGGQQAVAECWRNLTSCGAQPLALSDNLNFGNPEDPVIMGQFAQAVQGIAAACKALEFPVVSGNVSLYNETNGASIMPTPTIAGVGLINDLNQQVGIALRPNAGLALIGGHGGHLWQSMYLREILNLSDGAPPPVDLRHEKTNGDFARLLITSDHVYACHDISDGGLAIALSEMAMAGDTGFTVNLDYSGKREFIGRLFGEDQGRYVISYDQDKLEIITALAHQARVDFAILGHTGGDKMIINDIISLPVKSARQQHEQWLPDYMAAPED